MIRVLFICHGNICRSPMAEYVFKDMVARVGETEKFYITSAATSAEEIGHGIHYGTKRKLTEQGITCAGHRAVQMTKADYAEYDYLIGMDEANVHNMLRIAGGDPQGKIFKLLSFTGSKKDIADPWYTGNFDETYKDVEAGCKGLLAYLMKQETSAI